MRNRFLRCVAIVVVVLVAVRPVGRLPPAPTPHRPGRTLPAAAGMPSTSCRPRSSRPSRTAPPRRGDACGACSRCRHGRPVRRRLFRPVRHGRHEALNAVVTGSVHDLIRGSLIVSLGLFGLSLLAALSGPT